MSYPLPLLLYTWETKFPKGEERCPGSHRLSLTLFRAPSICPLFLPPSSLRFLLGPVHRAGGLLELRFRASHGNLSCGHSLVLSQWGLQSAASGLDHTEAEGFSDWPQATG